MFVVLEQRVLIKWPSLVQASVSYRRRVNLQFILELAHLTASITISGRRGLESILSRAFRWEKAINIPSIVKLVIKLKPPWLTKGKVIPVMGKARVMPPML